MTAINMILNSCIGKADAKLNNMQRLNCLFYILSMHSQTTNVPGVTVFNVRSTDSRYAGIIFYLPFGKQVNAPETQ